MLISSWNCISLRRNTWLKIAIDVIRGFIGAAYNLCEDAGIKNKGCEMKRGRDHVLSVIAVQRKAVVTAHLKSM